MNVLNVMTTGSLQRMNASNLNLPKTTANIGNAQEFRAKAAKLSR